MKSFFPTWRSYENVHIFFWLAKDTSWNHNWNVPWIVFSIPTVLVALDFVWQTAHVKVIASQFSACALFSRTAFRVAWSTTFTTSCSSCGLWRILCGLTASCSCPWSTMILCRSFRSICKTSTPCAGSVRGYWSSPSFWVSFCTWFGLPRARSSRQLTPPFTRPADTVTQLDRSFLSFSTTK
jgi:hypothetical protein